MFVRLSVGVAALCAAVLTVPTTSAAQDTTRTRDSLRMRDSLQRLDSLQRRDSIRLSLRSPRVTSQMRIPVRKEANGEVALLPDRDSLARADSIERADRMRADSIAQAERVRQDALAAIETARRDSLERVQRALQDSIAAVETARRDSVARADSIVRDNQLREQRRRDRHLFKDSGWYLGLSAGSAMPNGSFRDIGYERGWGVNVPFGYHARNQLLGVRFDMGYNQFEGGTFLGAGTGGAPLTLTNNNPKVLSATVNLTARLPLNQSRSIALYGVGGGGAYQFRDFGPTSALGGFLGNDVEAPFVGDSKKTRTRLGAQAGGGIDFGVGPASIFVESRFVNVFADRGDETAFSSFFGNERGKNVRWVPIVLGVTFR